MTAKAGTALMTFCIHYFESSLSGQFKTAKLISVEQILTVHGSWCTVEAPVFTLGTSQNGKMNVTFLKDGRPITCYSLPPWFKSIKLIWLSPSPLS